MSIGPGTRVGVYEVGEPLGEGGMGIVYRARDSRLQRDVAIKVIRQDLASDPGRATRFDREARLLASLSHPHIAVVHGLEHAGDARLLVLELVPGDTLADRLRNGPLPVREALSLALQIASGIEAAHERGIIHRDLKPANIKITPSGVVKILDFGLAKALSLDSASDPSMSSPTLTATGTVAGTVVGTAAYMSPEQSRGKEVDTRTDVWAFGCVVYDMLTGHNAFRAETMSDTLVAILTREPDWSRLPPDTPPPARRMLERCLQKDPARRLRDIGDARLDLEEALTWTPSQAPAAAAIQPVRRSPLPIIGALVAGAALAAAAMWMWRPETSAPAPAAQFTVALPQNERISETDFPAIAISPDDAHIVFVASRGGRSQLYLRALATLTTRPLAGTEGALSPFFSPDGQWVAFFAGGSLKKVQLAGGAVRTIAPAEIGFGGAWGRDNHIVYAPNNASELWRVPADGGTAAAVTTLDASRGEFSHRWPVILPDGKSIVFAVGTQGSWDDATIAVQTVGDKERRTLVEGGTSPHLSPERLLLYTRAGVLYRVPFDGTATRGGAEPVAGIGRIVQSSDGAAHYSVSSSGTLVYLPSAGSDAERTLVWVDREGNVQPLAAPPNAFADPRLSPDDRRLAITIGSATKNVWTYDIGANRLEQLTFDGGASPVWQADGSRVIFAAHRGGAPDLFARGLDSSGTEERLTRTPRTDVPAAAGGDGSIFYVESDAGGRDIVVLSRDGSPRPLLATPANETAPALSPQGTVLAYVSDASGEPEVYVAPLSDPQRATLVSSGGGAEPVWKRDGSELYYRSGARMMAAAIRTQPSLSAQPARELFTGTFESGSGGRAAYDVSRDGSRFLMIRAAEQKEPGGEFNVFLRWAASSVDRR